MWPGDAYTPAFDKTWGLAHGLLCASPRNRLRLVRDKYQLLICWQDKTSGRRKPALASVQEMTAQCFQPSARAKKHEQSNPAKPEYRQAGTYHPFFQHTVCS